MTLIIHHLNNSRSQRILWLLEELGADYRIEAYQRDAETNLAPQALSKVHPLGKSPVIEDGGRVISESGAIVEYLCATHGGASWLPDHGSGAWVDHLQWMQFAESSFFVPVMLKLYAARLGDAAAPLMPRITEQLAEHVTYAENALSDALHFVGTDWSAADVMMSLPAEIAVMQGFAPEGSNLKRFVEAIHARPAWQRAREKGGAYFMW